MVEELSKVANKEEPELLYLDGIVKHLGKLGYPVPIHFDWYHFYMQLYDEKYVPNIAFIELVNYLHKLSSYC